ncbi:MAG: hypothetical protein H0X25_08495 [Acidobacteriales bacterium]|nr:hypothetical protein [Terriglobales bacterium]
MMQGRAFFDLDGDGVVDVTIQDRHYRTYTGFWHSNTSQRLKVTGPPGGGVIGSGKYAGAMSAGLVIGSTRPFKDFGDKAISMATTGLAHCGSSCYVNIVEGPWISANKRFLGLRFRVGGETHYGWLRLNTRSSIFPPRVDATISGYAYEVSSNKSIMAGQLKENSSTDIGSADVTPGALGDLATGRSPQ